MAGLIVATKPSATAGQWFIDNCVRGYALDNIVAVYRVEDSIPFSHRIAAYHADILVALDVIEKVHGPIDEVRFGQRYAGAEYPWPDVARSDIVSYHRHAPEAIKKRVGK